MATSTSALLSSRSILKRIAACNVPPVAKLVDFVLPEDVTSSSPLGLVNPSIVKPILDSSDHFTINESNQLTFKPSAVTVGDRNAALAQASARLRDVGLIKAWRDELSPFTSSFTDLVRQHAAGEKYSGLSIERGAAALFSARGYGVHVNGYTTDEDGTLKLWVARRAEDKGVCPKMLDHIVAGGIPASHPLPSDNVVKECEEEAGIDPKLAKKAVPSGVVTYNGLDGWCTEGREDRPGVKEQGFKRDVLFVYDLELPSSFTPIVVDGEVDSFQLMDIEEVLATFEEGRSVQDSYKANCYLVVADFLIRKGYIMPEMEGYCEIVAGLRQ